MADKPTLIQKLVSVYKEVDHVEKRGTNSAQGYKYVRATDLAHAIRNALATAGVYAEINFKTERTYTIARGTDNNGVQKTPMNAVDVIATVVFHDVDSPEVITTSGLGSGADMGDKAIYKAQTGALKYALRNAFLVPDDADPENDADEPAAPRQQAANAKATPSGAKRGRPAATPKAEPKLTSSPETEQNTVVVAESAPKASAPVDNTPLPSAEEFKGYIEKGREFANNLKVAGMKPVGTINVKLTKFFQKRAGAADMKTISKASWESIFGEIHTLQGQPDGMSKIIDLIDKETA